MRHTLFHIAEHYELVPKQNFFTSEKNNLTNKNPENPPAFLTGFETILMLLSSTSFSVLLSRIQVSKVSGISVWLEVTEANLAEF